MLNRSSGKRESAGRGRYRGDRERRILENRARGWSAINRGARVRGTETLRHLPKGAPRGTSTSCEGRCRAAADGPGVATGAPALSLRGAATPPPVARRCVARRGARRRPSEGTDPHSGNDTASIPRRFSSGKVREIELSAVNINYCAEDFEIIPENY